MRSALRAKTVEKRHHNGVTRASASTANTSTAKPAHVPNEIDYDAYWYDAWAAAKDAEQKMRRDEQATRRQLAWWPKVFIYQLPRELSEGWNPGTATVEEVFGRTLQMLRSWDNATLNRIRHPPNWWGNLSTNRRTAMSQNVRDTNHYGLARALVYRLWKSRQYRTLDPAKADLFLVPLLPLPKRGYVITNSCKNVTDKKLASVLPHLTEATAHKHLFILSKEHYEGSKCFGWWANPTGLFRRAQRLSYSTMQPDNLRVDDYYPFERRGHVGPPSCNDLFTHPDCPVYPNAADAPYPSNVHWPPVSSARAVDTPPWADDTVTRPYRMVFLGGVAHGDTKVRKRIHRQCTSYRDANKCVLQRYSLSSLLLKYLSQFCLEPGGDSPFRRSITDSIAFGCIPVFFTGTQVDAYPWLWGDWRRAASVRVNRTLFLAGKLDLHRLLGSAPPELVTLMRQTLKRHARAFTISLADDPEDQLHLLMHGAVQAARRLELESNLSLAR